MEKQKRIKIIFTILIIGVSLFTVTYVLHIESESQGQQDVPVDDELRELEALDSE